MDVKACDKCNTPLDEKGSCVTCAAQAEGLELLTRSGYASVREMMERLEEQGFSPEMEQVPPRRPEEKVHALWNLYGSRDEVEKAIDFLRRDWKELLRDADAEVAAERGRVGIDLDAGGAIECPACGHSFVPSAGKVECPECGLALGAPADASPDEAE